MVTKLCNRCGEKKNASEFGNNRSKPDGRQAYCIACGREKDRQHYKDSVARKTNIVSANQRARARCVAFVRAYLAEHPCVDCFESDIRLLEFDHVKGKKIASISKLVFSGRSVPRVKKEIRKCVVRCVRCHRLKTVEQFGHYLLP